MGKRLAVSLLAVLLLLGPARATPLEGVPNPRARGSWVSDVAGVLDAATEARIDRMCDELERKNGTQLAVVTLQETDGRTPKAFATALFNRWGIGQKDVDNGVLFLVVMGQRRMEVEVGEGARRFMSDGTTSSILTRKVVPHFKKGKPAQGILTGVTEICQVLGPVSYQGSRRIAANAVMDFAGVLPAPDKELLRKRCDGLWKERGVELVVVLHKKPVSAEEEARRLGLGPNGVLALVNVAGGFVEVHGGADVVMPRMGLEAAQGQAQAKKWDLAAAELVNVVTRRTEGMRLGDRQVESPPVRTGADKPAAKTTTRPRRRSGSLTLGEMWVPITGGAGGLLLFALYLYRRNRARMCPRCNTRKKRLAENVDDRHLTSEQQLEESIGSVDYDVWYCPSCEDVHVEGYNAWLTGYGSCPKCSRRTLKTTRTTVEHPTYTSSGRGRADSRCENCPYTYTDYYTIPRKTRSSSSSSGGSRGSGGGGGFGGGRSRGGGSGASW